MQCSIRYKQTKILIYLTIPIILSIILSACSRTILDAKTQTATLDLPPSKTSRAQSTQVVNPDNENIVAIIIEDLSLRLAIPIDEIKIQSVEEVQWPNSGLGCPNTNLEYVDVIVPGYKIVLTAVKRDYSYHTDRISQFILCDEFGQPQFPLIPVTPGEIQDGVPWMPVDP
jgi:hypothetical protein